MTTLLDQLKTIVGAGAWKTDPAELQPRLTDWRGLVFGKTPILVMPKSRDEVSEVVRACVAAGVAIVPQGGNTGLCAGAVPGESGEQVLLSMEKMNRIRHVDASNFSMEVEAGCVLADIQRAARAVDRYFPLSLGAEGSCQIGGNLATNAGGVNVIRYGTARSLVLGLEVVLADGAVLEGLRSLRKDTAGYDLKQLFIGSEGTLGIITAATLRLFPDPGETATALLALSDSGDAVRLLARLRASLVDRIEAFELVSRPIFDLVEAHIPGARLPFDEAYPWYVLIETATGGDPELLENALSSAADKSLILDAAIAKNAKEAHNLWRLRHSIAEAERHDGTGLKHDISVPIGRMQEFLVRGEAQLARLMPEARLLVFGHVGDGNLHYNVALPRTSTPEALQAAGSRITAAIYDLVAEMGGSFSAEHGVGQSKRSYLEKYRAGAEINLMRRLKKALDPKNTLNPGKVI
ncbi:MAG: FAD-binding oxidoreductase [Gammaproteobacteria bacterium]|nr:FAD-binding oxidoreductase [Gammaproteobacteria bacterium]NND47840.1 FAD-binding oxidoreductase [Woeseiaceae bacterium]